MFIKFDYRCRNNDCAFTEERFVKKDLMDKQVCGHDGCEALMHRLPPATRTHFRFADKKLKR